MTPGNLKHVHPGDPLRIPASDWNAMVDATRAHYARHLGRTEPAVASSNTGGVSNVIFVRNDTGEDQPRGAVLGVTEPIITPSDHLEEFLRQPALIAGLPQWPDHFDRFVVLGEPLPSGAGGVGRGYAWGLRPVQINVIKESDDTAYVLHEITTHLQSGYAPSTVPIVWKQPGTGLVWGLVNLSRRIESRPIARLTNFNPATAEFSFVEINPDGSDKADSYVWDGGAAPNQPLVKNLSAAPVDIVGQRHTLWPVIDTSGATPELAWRFRGLKLNELFRFDCTQVGGAQASSSNGGASWRYDITLSGVTILADEDPVAAPHDYRRPAYVAHDPATKGLGYYTYLDPEDPAPTLIIHRLNEVPQFAACLEGGEV